MPGRLVDAARLGLDDAVLDLVGHPEPVPAADRVRRGDELDRGRRTRRRRERPASPRGSGPHRLRLDRDRLVPVGDAHDRLDDRPSTGRGSRATWPRASRPRCSRRSSTPSRPIAVGEPALEQPLAHLLAAAELVDEVRRRATACRSAAPGWPAGRSGRSARCRCPCRSSRRPRCRRRRSCIARTSIVPVTARPSGVVLKYVLPGARDVERAALQRDEALVDELRPGSRRSRPPRRRTRARAPGCRRRRPRRPGRGRR